MPYIFPSEEERHLRELLFTSCKTKEDVQSFVHLFLNIELPDCTVDPESNSNPLDMVWTCYNHLIWGNPDDSVSRYLFFSSRFAGKTLCESVIEVLLLLHSRIDVTHLAAIERQSRDCQKYIAKFYSLPALRGILSGDSKKEKVATFYVPNDGGPNLTEKELKTLPEDEHGNYIKVSNTVEVIVASLQSCNGKHSALLALDEIDVITNTDAYEEAKNVPTPGVRDDGSIMMPLTILCSTRKFAWGIVASEIEKADQTGLIVKHWNIIDSCEACPKSRHRPDLPKQERYISESLMSSVTPEAFETLPIKDKEKYQKIECFDGCVSNCKILPACKMNLASKQTSTSKFLKPISYVQNQIKTNNLDKCLSQLLCRKPSVEGLIYPSLSKERHVLSPAQAYEMTLGEACPNKYLTKENFVRWIKDRGDWAAGCDFGVTHLFAFVVGIKIRNMMFVTGVFAASELESAQQIAGIEPFKYLDPRVWADTEDPNMRAVLKRAGWRIPKWTKGKGSVAGGISAVKLKLLPTLDRQPELYFVHDYGEDPMMDLLFLHLKEWHYKLDAAGTPTETPSDDNKDLPDAFRYLVQNEFEVKGQFAISQEAESQPKILSQDGQPVYHAGSWMSQKISELTGGEVRPPQTSRPQMTIEEIGHSYYGEQNKEETKDRLGKSRGILWDFD